MKGSTKYKLYSVLPFCTQKGGIYMKYVGKWFFHSIGVMNESGEMVYMTAEEYINSPMEYIDKTDEEAVECEMHERKQTVASCVEICEDGKWYVMIPIPEGVSEEEVNAAVASGEINLRDGMLYDAPMLWEERDGKLWVNTGVEGEVLGEKADPWACATDDEGYFYMMTVRYKKGDE